MVQQRCLLNLLKKVMNDHDLMKAVEGLSEVTHVLVMVEIEPLSDKYVQILLDPMTFKKVSDVIWAAMLDSKKTPEAKFIPVRRMKPIIIPDGESSYSKEFIEKMRS